MALIAAAPFLSPTSATSVSSIDDDCRVGDAEKAVSFCLMRLARQLFRGKLFLPPYATAYGSYSPTVDYWRQSNFADCGRGDCRLIGVDAHGQL